jgi:hypothetical protein
MSFVGDTTSVPVEVAGDRLLYEGQPLATEAIGSCSGIGRLYLRPGEVELTDADDTALAGLVINVHRTSAGRRTHIRLGAGQALIEVDIGASRWIKVGERIGVRILRGRGIESARRQHARSFELRAAISQTRLWRDRGRRDAARDLLAQVYGRFTEGFNTLDLEEAKTLLAELTSEAIE